MHLSTECLHPTRPFSPFSPSARARCRYFSQTADPLLLILLLLSGVLPVKAQLVCTVILKRFWDTVRDLYPRVKKLSRLTLTGGPAPSPGVSREGSGTGAMIEDH